MSSSRIPIAVAGGPAFSFAYEDNLEQLEAAGAKLVIFDPRTTSSLPRGVKGLYAGGGFPEEYVKEISANSPLLADVYAKVTGGLVTWAECGGLLWLCRSLEGIAMCGVVAADASMTDRVTVGLPDGDASQSLPHRASRCSSRRARASRFRGVAGGWRTALDREWGQLEGGLGNANVARLLPAAPPRGRPFEGGVVCRGRRWRAGTRNSGGVARYRGRRRARRDQGEATTRGERGELGTRGVVVGEAHPRSATVARVAGDLKVRGAHKAGSPPDAQVLVESHAGNRDRAGVPGLRVLMGMGVKRAPGSARVLCHRVLTSRTPSRRNRTNPTRRRRAIRAMHEQHASDQVLRRGGEELRSGWSQPPR